MNIKISNKSIIIAILIIILIVILLADINSIASLIRNIKGAIIPFLWSVGIAFILSKPADFISIKLNKIIRNTKLCRLISAIASILLFLGISVGIVYLIIPKLFESLTDFINEIPQYLTNAESLFEKIFPGAGTIKNSEQLIEKILDIIQPYYAEITSVGIKYAADAIDIIIKAVIALVGSVYLLISKDTLIAQTKKLLFAVFSEKLAEKLIFIVRKVNSAIYVFLYSKAAVSLGIGLSTVLLLMIFNIPYALLIGTVMGVLNIVPMFGPLIGGVFCGFLLIIIDPVDALIFILATLLLQMIDAQIITPKLIGKSLGINPFWVLFSIMIFGGTAGIPGLILGVPVFSVLYTVIKEYSEEKLKEKGFSISAEDYKSDKKIR